MLPLISKGIVIAVKSVILKIPVYIIEMMRDRKYVWT